MEKQTETIDVGKIFIDPTGAGRLYIPKTVVSTMDLVNKDHMKLEVCGDILKAISLRRI